MKMVKMNIKDLPEEMSEEELQDLEKAEKLTPVYDDESPEMTPEKLSEFRRINRGKRLKKSISIRVSYQTLEKAQTYEQKGYTSFLSRLLDAAIEDENLVKKCL